MIFINSTVVKWFTHCIKREHRIGSAFGLRECNRGKHQERLCKEIDHSMYCVCGACGSCQAIDTRNNFVRLLKISKKILD